MTSVPALLWRWPRSLEFVVNRIHKGEGLFCVQLWDLEFGATLNSLGSTFPSHFFQARHWEAHDSLLLSTEGPAAGWHSLRSRSTPCKSAPWIPGFFPGVQAWSSQTGAAWRPVSWEEGLRHRPGPGKHSIRPLWNNQFRQLWGEQSLHAGNANQRLSLCSIREAHAADPGASRVTCEKQQSVFMFVVCLPDLPRSLCPGQSPG